MENQSSQYKEIIEKIDYNNYLLGINSNLKRNQQKKIQIINPQNRGKTPIYTRVKNLLNGENNNNLRLENRIEYKEREEIDPSSISYKSNNTLYNNVINKKRNINNVDNINNNYSVNYTMRDSNYSNYSASGFTTMTQMDNLNSKYNYYKVLFHQVKGHNYALLNQIKKDKNLNEINKALENENMMLKKENNKLKENINLHLHANSDDEDEKINNNNALNYNKYFNKNKENKNNDIDINYVLLQENKILKDEIKKLFKKNKKMKKIEEENNEEIESKDEKEEKGNKTEKKEIKKNRRKRTRKRAKKRAKKRKRRIGRNRRRRNKY